MNIVEELHPSVCRLKSPNMQELGGPCLFEEVLHEDHAQGLGGVDLPGSINSGNVGEGSGWVLDKIILFCKMGLAIEGREMEFSLFLPRWKQIG